MLFWQPPHLNGSLQSSTLLFPVSPLNAVVLVWTSTWKMYSPVKMLCYFINSHLISSFSLSLVISVSQTSLWAPPKNPIFDPNASPLHLKLISKSPPDQRESSKNTTAESMSIPFAQTSLSIPRPQKLCSVPIARNRLQILKFSDSLPFSSARRFVLYERRSSRFWIRAFSSGKIQTFFKRSSCWKELDFEIKLAHSTRIGQVVGLHPSF